MMKDDDDDDDEEEDDPNAGSKLPSSRYIDDEVEQSGDDHEEVSASARPSKSRKKMVPDDPLEQMIKSKDERFQYRKLKKED